MVPKISIILPTFNEAGSISALIDSIVNAVGNYDLEIVVVDDNSPDGTAEIVREKRKRIEYIELITMTRRLGLAESIFAGIQKTTGEMIIIMDSDFNHNPGYLPRMIEFLEDHDGVSASRFVPQGAMDGRFRYFCSKYFNYFIRLLLGSRFSDNLYGYICLKREAFKRVESKKIFWGHGDYYFRLLYYLQIEGLDIVEMPAINGKRIAGTGLDNYISIFLKYSYELFRFFWRVRFGGSLGGRA
jgi:dolichol-phosphate mannosyltransferase